MWIIYEARGVSAAAGLHAIIICCYELLASQEHSVVQNSCADAVRALTWTGSLLAFFVKGLIATERCSRQLRLHKTPNIHSVLMSVLTCTHV